MEFTGTCNTRLHEHHTNRGHLSIKTSVDTTLISQQAMITAVTDIPIGEIKIIINLKVITNITVSR
jgi:hypothetical protein